jgi:hypothetical protein
LECWYACSTTRISLHLQCFLALLAAFSQRHSRYRSLEKQVNPVIPPMKIIIYGLRIFSIPDFPSSGCRVPASLSLSAYRAQQRKGARHQSGFSCCLAFLVFVDVSWSILDALQGIQIVFYAQGKDVSLVSSELLGMCKTRFHVMLSIVSFFLYPSTYPY